jgi:MFS family permease
VKNVVLLGVVSLLTDASTEMIVPLLPAFLGTLGAGALALGWIEGLADAVASLLKIVSGRWSDRLGRRKPIVVAGYGISSLVRPLIALAVTSTHVLAVRVVDRIGKGLRTSPRDALIAASVGEAQRGAAFGLHRALDHAGAVIGPLAAFALLTFWSQDLRTLFWWSALPGAASMLVLILVRDRADPTPARDDAPTGNLLVLLFPLAIFTLGNASDVFLLLRAGETTSLRYLPLLWIGLHLVKMASAFVCGRLADRYGRVRLIACGWIYYAAIYAGFAFTQDKHQIWALLLAYGVFHGLTEGAERALVARLAPSARWGAAFGWYHLTLGALGLAANVMFGAVWQQFGSEAAFLMGASLAVVAAIALVFSNARSG